MLAGHQAQPGRQVSARGEGGALADRRDQMRSPRAGRRRDRGEALPGVVLGRDPVEGGVDPPDLRVQLPPFGPEPLEEIAQAPRQAVVGIFQDPGDCRSRWIRPQRTVRPHSSKKARS